MAFNLLLIILFLLALYKVFWGKNHNGESLISRIMGYFIDYFLKIGVPIILVLGYFQAQSQNAISHFGQEQKITYTHIFVGREAIPWSRTSVSFKNMIFLQYKGKDYECNCLDVICTYPLSDKKRLFFIKEAIVQFEKENSRFKFMTYDRCLLKKMVFSKPNDLKQLVYYYEKRHSSIQNKFNEYNIDLENGILERK